MLRFWTVVTKISIVSMNKVAAGAAAVVVKEVEVKRF
jgi:hypothetical protein